LRLRFHPPASFPPPLELRQTTCPSRLRVPGASLGVPLPHRGTSLRRPHPPGDPPPSFVPSSAFLTPSTVSSATCLAGLFHPAATSRVCPPGVCPSPRSRTGFPRPFHALLPLSALAFDQLGRPRLQGLAPRGECGVASGCLDPLRSAPLLGFSASSGFSPPAWCERLHAHSALDLRRDEPAASGPLRFTHASFGFPGTRRPTRSRFSGLNPCSPFEAQVRGLRTW